VDKTNGTWIGSIDGVQAASGNGASATVNAANLRSFAFVGTASCITYSTTGWAPFTAAQRVVGFNSLGASPL